MVYVNGSEGGYITIDEGLNVEVSKRSKEDYGNGREYYAFHGKKLTEIPDNVQEKPSWQYLRWHNENVLLLPAQPLSLYLAIISLSKNQGDFIWKPIHCDIAQHTYVRYNIDVVTSIFRDVFCLKDKSNDYPKGELLIYQTEDGRTKIDVFFEEDTIWLSQKQLSLLYQKGTNTINEHIRHIFDDGELSKEATIRKFRIVQNEGSRKVARDVEHYDLHMILAIGYRVRSHVGNQFRRWASEVLTEYMKKGFAMNDERLKDPKRFGVDYFDELLERIRDIRASEKRFYQKVKDIYTLAVDYDPNLEMTKEFFAAVQNKLHYSVHGHTAAELIAERADSSKDNMGLTCFAGNKVRKSDVTVAKNYLSEKEVAELNRIVTMFLDYAEDRAKRQIPMYMKDWIKALDGFLKFNEREILLNAGKISKEIAEAKALQHYELFNRQRLKKDDDDALLEIKKLEEFE